MLEVATVEDNRSRITTVAEVLACLLDKLAWAETMIQVNLAAAEAAEELKWLADDVAPAAPAELRVIEAE